ncbi:MAG: autotransporter assembly complex family protein [Alphaproteobacteria bacterium]
MLLPYWSGGAGLKDRHAGRAGIFDRTETKSYNRHKSLLRIATDPMRAATGECQLRWHPAIQDRGIISALTAVSFLLFLGGCSTPDVLSSSNSGSAAVQALPTSERYPYTVRMEGADDLEGRLREVSLAQRLIDEPPPSRTALVRRADTDLERFVQVLRSEGYYDGTARQDIRETEDGAELVFTIDSGPAYVLEEVLIAEGEGASRPATDETLERLNLEIGQVAAAQPVLSAEGGLRMSYREAGYPFAEIASRRTVIDPDRKTMKVTFRVDPGAAASFGTARVEGLSDVRESYLRKLVEWEPGARFDQRQVEATRRALAEADVFERASIEPVGPVKPDGSVDMAITVAERPHRSIGAGVSYSTDVGFGGRVQWEHRNLLHEGEKLRIAAQAAQIEQGLEGSFRNPYFLAPRQDFVSELEIKRATTEAYNEYRGTAFAGVERRFLEHWSATVGPSFDLSHIDDAPTEEGMNALLGLRGILRRDSSDNPLDPVSGSRVEFGLTPYIGVGPTDSRFLSASVAGSQYLSLDDADRFVLAARARIASIMGEERDRLPPGKRFYAGGGGSIRGYEFQMAGPLNQNAIPLGGRSAAEVGLELRTRIAGPFGLVPFIEGGNVYEDTVPRLDEGDMLWGAGLGFRYYSDFGPIRLDIATPLNRRDDIDDAFQFYVSFGQAF